MASAEFIFINTTDAATMSQPAAKRMRGHITRTNFAKRRAQKAKAKSGQSDLKSRQIVIPRDTSDAGRPPTQTSFTEVGLALALSAATSRADRFLSGQLRAYCVQIPLAGGGYLLRELK